MHDTLTAREYFDWQSYWVEEPWGAWRDNVHTAILAREVIRPHMKENAKIDLDVFMVHHPEDDKRRKRIAAMARLMAAATKV